MAYKGGIVVVRLSRHFFGDSILEVDDVRTLARDKGVASLSAVLGEYEQLPTSRLLRDVPIADVDEFERRTTPDHGFRQRSLTTYWRIDGRGAPVEDRARLIGRLLEVKNIAPDAVREVYEMPTGSEPSVVARDDPYARLERHLSRSPGGINARWAWKRSGGDGSRVGFVDVERGWLLEHVDLPPIRPLPWTSREMDASSIDHGTAVLGLVVGKDSDQGIIGIAPKAAWFSVSSHIVDGHEGNVTEAIHNATRSMAKGDVLLVEWQVDMAGSSGLPAELVSDTRDAISAATDFGVTVVACAGNGDHSLDNFPAIARSPGTDSGAIIVGACQAKLDATRTGHDRWAPQPGSGSNYGERVDCHALGERLVTAGPGVTDYRKNFGATSGAGALVAGAAVLLQSMYKAANNDRPADPRDIRKWLSDGTPQTGDRSKRIGNMPDLKKAVAAAGFIPQTVRP